MSKLTEYAWLALGIAFLFTGNPWLLGSTAGAMLINLRHKAVNQKNPTVLDLLGTAALAMLFAVKLAIAYPWIYLYASLGSVLGLAYYYLAPFDTQSAILRLCGSLVWAAIIYASVAVFCVAPVFFAVAFALLNTALLAATFFRLSLTEFLERDLWIGSVLPCLLWTGILASGMLYFPAFAGVAFSSISLLGLTAPVATGWFSTLAITFLVARQFENVLEATWHVVDATLFLCFGHWLLNSKRENLGLWWLTNKKDVLHINGDACSYAKANMPLTPKWQTAPLAPLWDAHIYDGKTLVAANPHFLFNVVRLTASLVGLGQDYDERHGSDKRTTRRGQAQRTF